MVSLPPSRLPSLADHYLSTSAMTADSWKLALSLRGPMALGPALGKFVWEETQAGCGRRPPSAASPKALRCPLTSASTHNSLYHN